MTEFIADFSRDKITPAVPKSPSFQDLQSTQDTLDQQTKNILEAWKKSPTWRNENRKTPKSSIYDSRIPNIN